MSRIIATQGPGRYLLDLGDGIDGRPMAQVVDTDEGVIFPPTNRESILARGYWEPIELSPEEQATILTGLTASA